MTILELQRRLAEVLASGTPADTIVLVSGYEDGYDTPGDLREVLVVKHGLGMPEFGEYGDAEELESDNPGRLLAIVLPR